MKCCAKITEDAEHMNGAKYLRPDFLAYIKGERDQQKDIKADDAQAHPDRSIRIREWHKKLEDAERQIFIKQQNNDMHDHKPNAQQRKMFMEVVGQDIFQNRFDESSRNRKAPHHGKP